MSELREAIKLAILDAANAWAAGEGCDELLEQSYGEVLADAALAAIEASGYVLAPLEPTEAMLAAGTEILCMGGYGLHSGPVKVYRAIIAARPRRHVRSLLRATHAGV